MLIFDIKLQLLLVLLMACHAHFSRLAPSVDAAETVDAATTSANADVFSLSEDPLAGFVPIGNPLESPLFRTPAADSSSASSSSRSSSTSSSNSRRFASAVASNVNHNNNNNNKGYSMLSFFVRNNKRDTASASASSSQSSSSSTNCRNPDQDYLENLLSEYQVFYRKYEEAVQRFKPESILLNEYLMNKDSVIRDQSQCNVQERNTTGINQQSLCPWRYVIKVRTDKFPQHRTEVKCTCDTCTPLTKNVLPKFLYGCRPVMKSEPVLVRGECGLDGKYSWRTAVEYVNVACVCAYNQNLLPQL